MNLKLFKAKKTKNKQQQQKTPQKTNLSKTKPNQAAHTFNPSTQETEAEADKCVSPRPALSCSKLQAYDNKTTLSQNQK